jgi:hypothetical protein
MKIKQWMEKTKDREQWRLVVEEAKAHPGLYCREDGILEKLPLQPCYKLILNECVYFAD